LRQQARFALIPISVAAVFVIRLSPISAQAARHVLRDPNGAPACVVTVPASRSGKPDDDRMLIDVRVPGTPAGSFLSRVAAEKQDFSLLPIRVQLVPTPGHDSRAQVAVSHVRPLSADFTPRRLGLGATAEADTFIRVEYARADLRGGVDLVAERTAVANTGERVTSQTRCRVGAVDANVWR
jgi:hypothetical protein